MSIAVDFNTEQSEVTLFVEGRFDFSCHQEFREAYSKHEAKQFVIDMSKTEYIDSSALGMLLLLREYSGSGDKCITLVGCNEAVRKILALSSFDKMFEIK